MDEHSLDLAQRAVAALETMADPGMSAGDWVALGVGLSQCLLIAWGPVDDEQEQCESGCPERPYSSSAMPKP